MLLKLIRLIRDSCLYLKNRIAVTTAMSVTPAYLQNPAALSGLVTDYRDWQIPLGRRFRALKIWFMLRTYGVSKIQTMIRRHVQLGEYFAQLVRSRPDILEIVAGPQFALTVLRCKLPDSVNGSLQQALTGANSHTDGEMNSFERKRNTAVSGDLNALTKQVYELINSRGEIFLTSSIASSIYVIRVVSANELAEQKYIKKAFDIIVSTTAEVLAAKGANGTV